MNVCTYVSTYVHIGRYFNSTEYKEKRNYRIVNPIELAQFHVCSGQNAKIIFLHLIYTEGHAMLVEHYSILIIMYVDM